MMKITDSEKSLFLEFVIYSFFACMTILHLFANSGNTLSSVLYFSITNTATFLICYMSFSIKNKTSNATIAVNLYCVYLICFTLFFIIVGIYSNNYKEYMKIIGSCTGALFYFVILSLIAIFKLIRYGYRR